MYLNIIFISSYVYSVIIYVHNVTTADAQSDVK